MRINRAFIAGVLFLSTNLCSGDTGSTRLFANFDNGEDFSATVHHYYHHSRHPGLSNYNGSEVTTLSLHRSFGPGVVHYATTYAQDEQHQYVGLSMRRATVAFFRGQADSFSKTGSALYRDLNQYFFHGGSRGLFALQGAGLDLEVSKHLSLQFSGTRVRSENVEDRSGYYAGFSAGRFQGGVFALERGSDRVGRGFGFSVSGRRMDLEYQEIQSETGAYLRRAGLSWFAKTGSRWSMDIEEAHNPLYRHGDEMRVMFRYRRALGPTVAFHATETGESEEQRKKKGDTFTKVIGAGLAVGLLATVLSSGDDNRDNSPRFATQNEAAFNVLNGINPVSVRENREHGGWIFRTADGTFGSTDPVAGTVSSVNIGIPAQVIPGGTVASASYHTHGGPDPRFDNENFSPQDVLSDIQQGVDGYLGTPAGLLKFHELVTGRIITLGTIAN